MKTQSLSMVMTRNPGPLPTVLALLMAACLPLRAQTLIHYHLNNTDAAMVAGGLVPNAGTLGRGIAGGTGITLSSDVPTSGVPPGLGNRSFDGAGTGGILAPGTQQLSKTNIFNAGGFTFEAWFKYTNSPAINSIIDYAGTEKLARAPGDPGPLMEANNTSFFQLGAAPANQWHYAAVVFTPVGPIDGSGNLTGTFAFYLNTNAPVSFTSNVVITTFGDSLNRTIGVGMHPAGFSGDYFHGLIFSPRVTLGALPGSSLLFKPRVVVNNTNDSGIGSLRTVISSAPYGAIITFDPALSGQTITLTSGQITITNNLTIDSSELPVGVTISGGNNSRVFQMNAAARVVLNSLNIRDGFAPGGIYPANAGGGILNFGDLTLNGCTLQNNRATQGTVPGGGGIENYIGALILNNSTLVTNSTSGYGGGLEHNGGACSIYNATICGNNANISGGGISESSPVAITNTIVALNTAPSTPDYDNVPPGANNLIGGTPHLAALGYYGGPTPTMPPLPGSPAIDTGGPTSLTTDQRGFSRMLDGNGNGTVVPDIGAVEVSYITVDGSRDAAYGAALAVQTVQTGFGDASPPDSLGGNELDAAYANISNGRLYLMLAGNLEPNFNKVEVFIDSRPGGENTLSAMPQYDFFNGSSWTSVNLGGLKFDTNFSADYHLFARLGGATSPFQVDFINRQGGVSATVPGSSGDSPAMSELKASGSIAAGNFGPNASGTALTKNLDFAINDNNAAGVTGGSAAADQTAAQAVTTGTEYSIALADLGNPPAGSIIKIVAMNNNGDNNYLSNQLLGGLPAGIGNLGGDGSGGFTGTLSGVNLNNFAGSQYFTIVVPASPPAPALIAQRSGNFVTVSWIDPFNEWQLQTAATLASPNSWSDSLLLPTASGNQRQVTVQPGGSLFFRLRKP